MKKTKMIAKTIQFPPELIQETKQACLELDMSFSQLVRTATCLFIKHKCQDQLKQILAEGYREKAQLNQCICHEFDRFDEDDFNEHKNQ